MPSALGFYGTAVEGLSAVSRWLRPQNHVSDSVCVERITQPWTSVPPAVVDGTSARFELAGRGAVEVSRHSNVISASLSPECGDGELLHPLITSAVAVRKMWSGNDVLHGGVVGQGNAALCVLGGREFGKSSTLFALQRRSRLSVFSDDLCVTDGSFAWAGPGCLDLRSAPADAQASGEVVRAGSRFRVTLPDVETTVRLVGFVLLQWGPEPKSYPVGADRAVETVVASRMHKTVNMDPVRLLGLAALPMLCVERPKSLDHLDSTARCIERWLESLSAREA